MTCLVLQLSLIYSSIFDYLVRYELNVQIYVRYCKTVSIESRQDAKIRNSQKNMSPVILKEV